MSYRFRFGNQKLTAFIFLFLAGVCALTALANWPIGVSDDNTTVPSLAPLLEGKTSAVVQISIVPRINTSRGWNDSIFDRWRRHRQQNEEREYFSGSGVVIDALNGYVLTNHHVIQNANQAFVTLQDLSRYEAKIVGSDSPTDIALLKIDASELTELPLQDSDKLRVGDFVIAIGNPFGYGQTVTTGIVSGLGRKLQGPGNLQEDRYEDFIQTDASINPGNSGGALIDLRGNLIGINTAIVSTSGSSSGIGFAIPSNMAKSVVNQLREYGNVERGLFGVYTDELSQELVDLYELPSKSGALVTGVIPGSSADLAGVQVEDVIISIDADSIQGPTELRNVLGLKRAGDEFNVTIQRDGSQRIIRAAVTPEFENELEVSVDDSLLWGVTLADIPTIHADYREGAGLLISQIRTDSRAYRSGLRENDIIRAINRTRVRDLDAVTDTMLEQRPMLLHVARRNASFLVYLE